MAWRGLHQAASLAALLLIWHVCTMLVPSHVLPPPLLVGQVMVHAVVAGDLIHHLGMTLGRVAAAFTLALGLGTAVGILMGRRPRLDRFFDAWLVLFLNLPALVSCILCYIWFGLTETAAILAVTINKLPATIVTIREGARALDPAMQDVALLYRFGLRRTLAFVVLPQLAPYLLVAARSGLALIWKIVLVVEMLGRSDGIGFKLHVYFETFDVAGILAYSLAFIAVVQGIEWAILVPLERKVMAWRG